MNEAISFDLGQMSFRYTFLPFLPRPIGSRVKSICIEPASA